MTPLLAYLAYAIEAFVILFALGFAIYMLAHQDDWRYKK